MTYNSSNMQNAQSRLIRAAVVMALCAMVTLIGAQSAKAAPTFGCNKTYSKSERTICNSHELGKLDRWMAKEYQFLRSSMNRKDRRALRTDQRAWLKVRNQCSSSTSCISDQYYFRISELVEWNMP